MPTLFRARPDAVRRVREFAERCGEPGTLPPAEPVPSELDVTVRNPRFDRLAIRFDLDGAFAGEEPFIPRRESVSLGTLAPRAGRRRLGVQLSGERTFFYFDGDVDVPAKRAPLVVDVWSRIYPPDLRLGDRWINPPPGRHVPPDGDAGCPGPGDCRLWLIDRDRDPVAVVAPDPDALLDLWIDGVRIFAFAATSINLVTPVLHGALLSPGRHHVRIGDPRRRALVLDTDLALDPASEHFIEITGRRHVRVRRGDAVLFEDDGAERPFRQGAALTDELPDPSRQVQGIPIPPGAEGYIDEMEHELKFKRAMAQNFKDFKERKAAVERKKAAREVLTPEEQDIDGIDTYDKLDQWVRKKKKAEHGWDLVTGASTSPEGEKTFHGPEPTDPFGKLKKDEAMDIHEPSHVADVEALALQYFVDLKKLKAYYDRWRRLLEWFENAKKAKDAGLPEPPAPQSTSEEIDLTIWRLLHDGDIKRYYKALDDPIRGADAEIREYLAGADFWEAVLNYLKAKSYGWVVTDMALNIPVGGTKPITVEQTPNLPPRVRVIEGAANVDVSPTRQTRSNPIWGEFKIDVKGKTKGPVKIEVICGTLRKVIVINVV